MKSKGVTSITIGSSILWAAAIIASALILRGTTQAVEILFVLIVLSAASFLMLQRSKSAITPE
ncbi:MAG TPA: hypothetical protein VK880_14350 [Anaerolineales bacterium]|nr:hypothetical protein [Anaerolineales bacterium]